MNRILYSAKVWLFVLLVGMASTVWAQSDDFTTWTKFKVNHKIDSRFSVSGDLELRTKEDMSRIDRWGAFCRWCLSCIFFLEFGCRL